MRLLYYLNLVLASLSFLWVWSVSPFLSSALFFLSSAPFFSSFWGGVFLLLSALFLEMAFPSFVFGFWVVLFFLLWLLMESLGRVFTSPLPLKTLLTLILWLGAVFFSGYDIKGFLMGQGFIFLLLNLNLLRCFLRERGVLR